VALSGFKQIVATKAIPETTFPIPKRQVLTRCTEKIFSKLNGIINYRVSSVGFAA